MDALSSAAEAYDYPCNLQAGKYGSGLRAFQDIQAAGMLPNVVTYCGTQAQCLAFMLLVCSLVN